MGATAEMMLHTLGRTCRATVRAIPPERERELIAAAVIRHAERGSDVCDVPVFWHMLMLAIRLVPGRIFKRLDL